MSLPVVGLESMLKGGTKNLEGTDEAVFSNIAACKELASVARTSMGPQGLFKMIVTHLEKLVITKNAAEITSELEVRHPAAKIVVMAAENQALEYGDGTNLVIALAGELLGNAELLLKQGIPVTEIVAGYELAGSMTPQLLRKLTVFTAKPNDEDLRKVVRSAVEAKQYGYEDVLTSLVVSAVMQIAENGNFNPDHVRVAKVQGGALEESFVVDGFVVPAVPRGSLQRLENCKIAVFICPIELKETETKGTVLLENAQELLDYSKNEEQAYESLILGLKNAGINTIVSEYNFHELAIHFCDKYGIMAIKIGSKYEVRRFALSVNAELLSVCEPPENSSVLGFSPLLYVDEVGSQKILISRNENSKIATILIRSATENFMNDAAVALGSGINVAKAAMQDAEFLPGAGASELALAVELRKACLQMQGLEEYGVRAFADALEVVPRVLAETSGQKADRVIANLVSAYNKGEIRGVDIENDCLCDPVAAGIFDNIGVKNWAIKIACDAACSILRVDQVIMRKQAGGPAPEEAGEDEWN